MASYKTVECKSTLGAVIGDACAQLEELAGECDDAYNNFPNSDHPKAQAFSDAASALQSASEPDVPEWMADLPVVYSESVPTRKGRAAGRAVRCGNACAMLQAAAEKAREMCEDEKDEDKVSEAESLADELENIVGDCEGVEFPGMFG